jgi:hypothetical protein
MTYRSNGRHAQSTDEKFAHEITREIVNRHLRDINDKISEEDIRKINTTNLPVSNIEDVEPGVDHPKEEENHSQIASPWIINSD